MEVDSSFGWGRSTDRFNPIPAWERSGCASAHGRRASRFRSRSIGRAGFISRSSPPNARSIKVTSFLWCETTARSIFLFKLRTTRGTLTTAGPITIRFMTTVKTSGIGGPMFVRALTARTANIARSSTPRFRSARENSCCGSSRSFTGWNGRATISVTYPTSIRTPIPRGLSAPARGSRRRQDGLRQNRRNIYRDVIPGAEGESRLQRLDDLVGRRSFRAPRLC